MTVDLLLVGILGALWALLERRRLAPLLQSEARALRPRGLRSPLLWLLGCAALFSAGAWAQAVEVLGPSGAWALLSGGPDPMEREQCFKHQRLSQKLAEYAGDGPLTCPWGGGVYLADKTGPRCPVHGRPK